MSFGRDKTKPAVKRAWLLAFAFLALALIAGFLGWQPSLTGESTPLFQPAEKREILSVVREDACRQSWSELKRWRLKPSMAWFLSAFKPKHVMLGRERDGAVWIHVGVRDKNAPDGYSRWSRYILTKEKGHWIISTRY